VISLKKATAFILSILFIVTLTSFSFAGSGARMRQAMEGMGGKEIAGEVTAVDTKEKKITVKGMRGLVTATCDEKTMVKMGTEMKTCADIKVGDKANMLFEAGEGKNVAKSVILSLPAVPSPAEKKAEPPTEKKAEPPKTETKQ
jgi:Cu/Ag efflux protein CusF